MDDQSDTAVGTSDDAWTRIQLLAYHMDRLEEGASERLQRHGICSFLHVVPAAQRADDIILFYGLLVRRHVALELGLRLADLESIKQAFRRDEVFCLEACPELSEWLEEFDEALNSLQYNLPEECWPPPDDQPDLPLLPVEEDGRDFVRAPTTDHVWQRLAHRHDPSKRGVPDRTEEFVASLYEEA